MKTILILTAFCTLSRVAGRSVYLKASVVANRIMGKYLACIMISFRELFFKSFSFKDKKAQLKLKQIFYSLRFSVVFQYLGLHYLDF